MSDRTRWGTIDHGKYAHIIGGPTAYEISIGTLKLMSHRSHKLYFHVKLFDECKEAKFSGALIVPFNLIALSFTYIPDDIKLFVTLNTGYDVERSLYDHNLPLSAEELEVIRQTNRAPWLKEGTALEIHYSTRTKRGLLSEPVDDNAYYSII